MWSKMGRSGDTACVCDAAVVSLYIYGREEEGDRSHEKARGWAGSDCQECLSRHHASAEREAHEAKRPMKNEAAFKCKETHM